MGIIMKDGRQYGVGGITPAENVTYDNTQSGMSATDVQGAIDELKNGSLYYRKGEFFEITGVVYCHSLTNGAGDKCSAFLAIPKMARTGQTFTYSITGSNVRTNSAVATSLTLTNVLIRGNVLVIDFNLGSNVGGNQIANVALSGVRIDFTSD